MNIETIIPSFMLSSDTVLEGLEKDPMPETPVKSEPITTDPESDPKEVDIEQD